MKTKLSLKRRLAMFSMALAMAMLFGAPVGSNLVAPVARGAAEPVAVAVNWNSFAMFAVSEPEG